ncbi:hypothetical protein [Haloarchaeobius amylolyticus]|uniref:hypothetical protein n=1 Tax=Haloarchaeobius amylolyticus TaxID=1198296 RepID=UPI0022703FCB|nr:hypothetical protein [Haloarchaeobius amylolyticus]
MYPDHFCGVIDIHEGPKAVPDSQPTIRMTGHFSIIPVPRAAKLVVGDPVELLVDILFLNLSK